MSKKTFLLIGAMLAVMAGVLLLKTPASKNLPGEAPAAVARVESESPASKTVVAEKTPALANRQPAASTSAVNFQTPSAIHPEPAAPAGAMVANNGPALVPGEMVAVQVVAGGKTFGNLTPDQVGVFPQVNIDARQQVAVTASWPDGQPGQKVVVAAEDGGQVADAKHPVGFTLDARRQVTFDFTADSNPGIYRVTLRKGADVKTVQFWAGPELALKQQ